MQDATLSYCDGLETTISYENVILMNMNISVFE